MQATIFRFTIHLKDSSKYIYPGDYKMIGIDIPWRVERLRPILHDYSLTSSVRFNDNEPGYIYDSIDDFCDANDLSRFRAYINGVYGFMSLFGVDSEEYSGAITPNYLIRDSNYIDLIAVAWFDGWVPGNIHNLYLCRGFRYKNLIGFNTEKTSSAMGYSFYTFEPYEYDKSLIGEPYSRVSVVSGRVVDFRVSAFKKIIESGHISQYEDFGVEKCNLMDSYGDMVLSYIELARFDDFSLRFGMIQMHSLVEVEFELNRFGIIVANMLVDMDEMKYEIGRLQVDI